MEITNIDNPSKIKIEGYKRSNQRPFFLDTNGLLKGEWSDCHVTPNGNGGILEYGLFYSKRYDYIPISEEGLFYHKFSCRKYDVVISMRRGLFMCIKNGRYGLIDNNDHCILHTCYKNIEQESVDSEIFIVETETGFFLFNAGTSMQSKEYDSLCFSTYQYVLCELSGKYGLLDYKGEEVIRPLFEKNDRVGNNIGTYDDGAQLRVTFQDKRYQLMVKDNMFWGLIPLNYDYCVKVAINGFGGFANELYLTKKDKKYGIIHWSGKVITEPILDDIIFWPRQDNLNLYSTNIIPKIDFIKRTDNKSYWRNNVFIIGKKEDGYMLFDAERCNCIIDKCEKIEYNLFEDRIGQFYSRGSILGFISFKKKDITGYIVHDGISIASDNYDIIEPCSCWLKVSKDGLWGILDGFGHEIIPCMYNSIHRKDSYLFIAEKDGRKDTIKLREKRSILSNNSDNNSYYESKHYSEFSGTYAQDVAGFSDEEIWDLFDGEPDAYWNID